VKHPKLRDLGGEGAWGFVGANKERRLAVGRIDNFDASGRFLSGKQIRAELCKSDAGAAFAQH
jgi:hypothetical protein